MEKDVGLFAYVSSEKIFKTISRFVHTSNIIRNQLNGIPEYSTKAYFMAVDYLTHTSQHQGNHSPYSAYLTREGNLVLMEKRF